MMRNEKGITLIALVVTIFVMIILAGIGATDGFDRINDTMDNRDRVELGIVRQAAIEQYQQAVAVKKTEKDTSKALVEFWVGEKIEDASTIDLPESSEFDATSDTTAFFEKIKAYHCQYQEDYYYRLTPEDLKKIGVGDATDTYIVNYHTAEVYNETKKVNKNRELLYLPSILYQNTENTGDENSFNDWT